MPIDPERNKILKHMWLLDEKMSSGESLTADEERWYRDNLLTIQKYYAEANAYWARKKYT